MASKLPSRQLVVDACVLRSAGDTEHPVSSKCRQTLNNILSICHHAVLNEKLRAEWNLHASRRAKKWWGAMQRRGKIDAASRSQAGIRLARVSAQDRSIIEKDRMLVDIAYGTGRIIISRDNALIEALQRTDNERFLNEIRWFNPVVAQDNYLASL
jgi:hypothetical protein